MRALVPIANGVEDIETVTIIDVLRRAQFEVTVACIEHDLTVTMAKGCKLTADTAFNDIKKETFDLIAVPGMHGRIAIAMKDDRRHYRAASRIRCASGQDRG